MKRLLAVTAAIFCLTALAQTAGINGKWHFALDTEGGPRAIEAVFAVDGGGKVTGSFGTDAVAGTFKDGKLDLSFTTHPEETGAGTIHLTGKLDGDAIVGGWEFSEYNGTFKATRAN